jgi:hypothetical protein
MGIIGATKRAIEFRHDQTRTAASLALSEEGHVLAELLAELGFSHGLRCLSCV